MAFGDGYNYLSGLGGAARVKWQPTLSRTRTTKKDVLHFDGRVYPLAYFGESRDEIWDASYRVRKDIDGDIWNDLVSLEGQVLLWQDVFGNSFNVIISDLGQDFPVDDPPNNNMYIVRFKMQRVE